MRYISQKKFDEQMLKINRENKQIEMRKQLKEAKLKTKNKQPMKTSNKVLLVSIFSIVLFTIACMVIQYKTMIEVSSTLITLWFSFWTVEIASLTGIKVAKVVKDYGAYDEFTSDDLTMMEDANEEVNADDSSADEESAG